MKRGTYIAINKQFKVQEFNHGVEKKNHAEDKICKSFAKKVGIELFCGGGGRRKSKERKKKLGGDLLCHLCSFDWNWGTEISRAGRHLGT